MMEPKKKQRSFACRWLPSVILLSAVFFIGSAFMVNNYTEKVLGCQIHVIKATRPNLCENQCRPDGTEALPVGIVSKTSDLEMRPLRGPPKKKKSKSPVNLLAIAAGIKQKKNVNEIVKKFPLADFALMLFHYDGNLEGWKDLKWTNNAIHVSAINQTKWWFAKRFLHPDVVAHYDYIFLWDEDLGVANFHAGRYLSIITKERLQISHPAINPDQSDVPYKLTAREVNSKVHRKDLNLGDPGRRYFENSKEPPSKGLVEMMAPVFSRASWRCAWYMIQNDLVHAWGLYFKLGYCAQENGTASIGIVDSEYVVHFGLPTLRSLARKQTERRVEKQDSPKQLPDKGKTVGKECFIELENFKNRWNKAVAEDECWVDTFQQPFQAQMDSEKLRVEEWLERGNLSTGY